MQSPKIYKVQKNTMSDIIFLGTTTDFGEAFGGDLSNSLKMWIKRKQSDHSNLLNNT